MLPRMTNKRNNHKKTPNTLKHLWESPENSGQGFADSNTPVFRTYLLVDWLLVKFIDHGR